MEQKKLIGYACAYTPLALIHAAGFTPYRILPDKDCPDQAGLILHDNLCPHVKRILDRAMDNQLPDLDGMVFMNSCDSMRRLADAWQQARPDIKMTLVDLPITSSDRDCAFFQGELQELSSTLEEWKGETLTPERLTGSIQIYNSLAENLEKLNTELQRGSTYNGAGLLQSTCLKASCTAPEEMVAEVESLIGSAGEEQQKDNSVPIYLFGNVLPDAEAFKMFAECGAGIVRDDLCTGSRLFAEVATRAEGLDDLLLDYAAGILNRQPCARTIVEAQPGKLAKDVIAGAKQYQVKGVIGYSLKFCDPYIARLPGIRAALKAEGIPFLMLEGDCTNRSIGQQKTRIEAFIEMLR